MSEATELVGCDDYITMELDSGIVEDAGCIL
jgi:hypothetical protein